MLSVWIEPGLQIFKYYERFSMVEDLNNDKWNGTRKKKKYNKQINYI